MKFRVVLSCHLIISGMFLFHLFVFHKCY
uniref:Uncharacterized protein n=1 Tax=Arundo donax TaxID=35708 RepID=A0A0A9ENM8_ARUDO